MRKVRSERDTIGCAASEVFYVPLTKHEAAIGRRLYGIHTRKGIVTLTGKIGRGDSSQSLCFVTEQ
ncbi:MAG: hypothetical protein OJF51_004669 [Nitrospira sp.]|jgi:hypothetical protein|nr:MAG: hypothetical protein OJF51_004669 [Nitrospira sp.]